MLIAHHLDGVRIHEFGKGVEVGDLLLTQSNTIAPVEGANVGLNGINHCSPSVGCCIDRTQMRLQRKQRTLT